MLINERDLVLNLDYLMILLYSFLRDCEELAKATNGTASVLQIPEISSVKKLLVKFSTDMVFLMKPTKYKAIEPVCGMELQRFNKKETAENCIAHTVTLI